MGIYKTSNPEKVLKFKEAALQGENIVIQTDIGGLNATITPGWLNYGSDLWYGEPGYALRYSKPGTPHAIDDTLPAATPFTIYTYADGADQQSEEEGRVEV